ncbi:hypothetical protein EVAR_31065_1 [Eumeta japonica]|uniref:Uncharacterized protein n=1 Tax=Eumeta variegata TaxID=151549 RepID=A0A4C1XHP7_EUMVA|nr:hypothetical protein EVAR_31065_1 [Eumeta japonica]
MRCVSKLGGTHLCKLVKSLYCTSPAEVKGRRKAAALRSMTSAVTSRGRNDGTSASEFLLSPFRCSRLTRGQERRLPSKLLGSIPSENSLGDVDPIGLVIINYYLLSYNETMFIKSVNDVIEKYRIL